MSEKNELKSDPATSKNSGAQSYSGSKNIKSNSVKKAEIEPMKTIMFKENRKFDLHIGRNMLAFLGRESKSVPACWLQHKDWQNVAKYFIIKGA